MGAEVPLAELEATATATAVGFSGRGSGVLRRKAGGQRRARIAAAGPSRLLRLALARAASEGMGLALGMRDPAAEIVSLADLLERAEDRALHLLLAGPGEGLGLAVLAPGLLSALIEWQTMRRITAAEAPPRVPTRTDAAMVTGFVDRALAAFAQSLSGSADEGLAAGFRTATFLPDPRPLGHLLDDVPYRLFVASAEVGSAGRGGTLLLALPAEARGGRGRGAPARVDPAAWSEAIGRAVATAPARLEAVLARVSLPLSAALTLAPGALLAIPRAALDRVVLEGPGGEVIATGRLGRSRGNRAVRLAPAAAEGAPPPAAVPAATKAVASPPAAVPAPQPTGVGTLRPGPAATGPPPGR